MTVIRSIPLKGKILSWFLVILASVLSACSNLDKLQDKEVLNMKVFEQRAPASLSPPGEENVAIVDGVHIRSQADYHFTMGEAYSLNGQVNRAIEAFNMTLVYDPESPKVRFRLASEYLKKGFISEAIENAELALKYDDKLTDGYILLGSLYSSLKMYERAEEQYRKILSYEPKNEEASLYIGAVMVERGDLKQAISHFTKIAQEKDSNVRHLAHYYKGRVYLEEKNLSAAARSFEKSLQEKPEFVDSIVALGKVYEASGEQEKAIGLYVSYQERFGDNEQVAEILGRIYMENERYDEAYWQFSILERSSVDNLGVKVKMAFLLIEKGSLREAAAKLQEVLREVPESDKIRFYLGAVYEGLKNYDLAIEQFSKIPPASSFYVDATTHAVYLYKLKGDYQKALAWLDTASQIRDDVLQFYTLHVSLLDDQKEYTKALAVLEKAKPKFPESTQIHFFLGSVHDKLGNKEKTIASMKDVLNLDEMHVQALNYLAYTYAELGTNLVEATEYAEKASRQRPDDAYITDTLGWVLYKRGEYAEAVKHLERAYTLKSNEGIIAEHLGDAYYRNQLPTKALWMYQKAMELSASATERQKLTAKILEVEKASMEARSETKLMDGKNALIMGQDKAAPITQPELPKKKREISSEIQR